MAYKALYRTYRPSTFDEVAGQQHIVSTIKNALRTGKIAHAYLFAGPRGTGKTTMAKLLAKALNCEEGIGSQCNECKNCRAINEGTHPDVLEIDAASNNGVDEIRDLIDKVKYGTILGRYKVYIIDEVHMMTPGAFNALLKTLEEPPEHVIFILATTEPHKILPTILSRCQRYDFSKLSDEEIKERIKIVLEKENIKYNEEAVNLIVSLSDGGMRDALSILDQVLAYTGDNLNVKDVLDMFALESKEEMLTLLSSIGYGNVPDVLARLNKYIQRGTDIKRLANDLLEILKDLLIYKSSAVGDYLQKTSVEEIRTIDAVISEESCMEMVDALMNAVKDFKNVTSIVPLFEVTMLKLASINKKPSQIVRETPRPVEPTPAPAPVVQQAPLPEVKPQPTPVAEPEPVLDNPDQGNLFDEPKEELPPQPVVLSEELLILKGSDSASPTHFKIDTDTLIDVITASKKEIKNKLLDSWSNLKRMIPHPSLGKAASLLADGHLLVASNKIMIIEHPMQKGVDNINDKNTQQALQDVVQSVFGNKMFIYAITRNESVDLQKKFIDRKVIGKLPKPEDIKLEFEGE